MLGNVWELVQDRYGKYPGGAVTDPAGPDAGWEQVVRASVLDVKWISSEKRFARNFRWTWRHGNRTETETTGGALPGVRE